MAEVGAGREERRRLELEAAEAAERERQRIEREKAIEDENRRRALEAAQRAEEERRSQNSDVMASFIKFALVPCVAIGFLVAILNSGNTSGEAGKSSSNLVSAASKAAGMPNSTSGLIKTMSL